MKCAVFNNNQNKISIIHVSPELIQKGITCECIFDKDVPSGLYYKIIQDSDSPSREFRSAWEMEINESNADGVGLTKEEFEAKYPQYKRWSVI